MEQGLSGQIKELMRLSVNMRMANTLVRGWLSYTWALVLVGTREAGVAMWA